MKAVRVGCSGWSYDSWRQGIYRGVPASRWLERYAELFDTVEVNGTFYRLVKRETVEGWVARTPPGFLFAVKASRYLTHMRRLRDIEQGVARFWEPLEPLREADKLGPVLWQLPESFHRDDAVLGSALELLPPAQHCFEFRHPSWFAPPVRRLLERHGASLAIGHDARRELPAASPLGGIAYLRLHYGSRGRRGNYSAAELEEWRRRVAAWRSRREVLVYLNNDWEGFAPANARELWNGLSPGALT
ncbi:MAG TPA: DUF72 domain-containing protein [Solirubrobacterales bacterium]|jgi:uncharacterized protein YecE (DUF72 family)|nr:DUF72 domain-containing protein [Solirubrobacterales bacterium]